MNEYITQNACIVHHFKTNKKNHDIIHILTNAQICL